MAHFARIGQDGVVQQVVVIANARCLGPNGQEDEAVGAAFCRSLFGGGEWRQTSYNGNMRRNFAGVGYRYDVVRDAFVPPRPYPSWTLDEDTCTWRPPVPRPTDGAWEWDEGSVAWVPITS